MLAAAGAVGVVVGEIAGGDGVAWGAPSSPGRMGQQLTTRHDLVAKDSEVPCPSSIAVGEAAFADKHEWGHTNRIEKIMPTRPLRPI